MEAAGPEPAACDACASAAPHVPSAYSAAASMHSFANEADADDRVGAMTDAWVLAEVICISALENNVAQVHEALLCSKADTRNNSGVLICRLTGHSSSITSTLMALDELRPCSRCVTEAACKVRPGRSNGALFLAPMTKERMREAGIDSTRRNVAVLCSDWNAVVQALKLVPRRKRPPLQLETGPCEASSCAGPKQDLVDVVDFRSDAGFGKDIEQDADGRPRHAELIISRVHLFSCQ